MSKAKLKKELQKLTKAQLIEQVLELYDNYKPVKEFYTQYLNPDEKGAFEKYRRKIIHEFYPPTKSFNPGLRFSEAKKAISDFKVLKPSPELIADLMMTLAENACEFTSDFGDMSEQYYTSTVNNYERALKYMAEQDLLPLFKLRSQQCLEYAKDCGYGFPDEMQEVYSEYYNS